jgi:hypothetical protein
MTEGRHEPNASDRIVPLRPRAPRKKDPSLSNKLSRWSASIGDFARFESTEPDDYRHRMMINLAAVLFCLLLILGGVWIANKMAEMRKNQDCVLSGRRGCTQVEMPARDRW